MRKKVDFGKSLGAGLLAQPPALKTGVLTDWDPLEVSGLEIRLVKGITESVTHMYVCMYVCMHVCMYACMYVYIYIGLWAGNKACKRHYRICYDSLWG